MPDSELDVADVADSNGFTEEDGDESKIWSEANYGTYGPQH